MNKLKKLTIAILLSSFSLCYLSCGKNPDKELNYEGISFKYPSYWNMTTEKSESNSVYINGEEKFHKETILMIAVSPAEVEPKYFLDGIISKMEREYEVSKEPLEEGEYGKYKALSIKYKAEGKLDKVYGIAYAFNVDGKTLLIVKQSDKDYELKHQKYKLIENSFNIEKPAQDSIP
ncbi:hypothetical protein [Prevotella sp. 10(H)]|uniref:hypothetical protein n=1 Tax=Prevotella sp. 10(H) TaxID=1158294 RepID=UPI0004A74E8F|nr:hypothetical protein [Prevotella sp. 10(H)]